MSETKQRFWLEFDFPMKLGDEIHWFPHKQKMEGTTQDAKEHVKWLKKYGTMKNIKLSRRNK